MYKLFHVGAPKPRAADKLQAPDNTSNARDYSLFVGSDRRPKFH